MRNGGVDSFRYWIDYNTKFMKINTQFFARILLLAFLLLMALMFTGCKSKQITVDTEKESEISTSEITSGLIQTEYRDRLVYITRPTSGNTIIKNPCKDGVLASIDTQIKSGGNTSRIYSKDGKLFLEQYIDSTSNSLEQRYLMQYKKDSVTLYNKLYRELDHSEEVKVYVYPWDYYAFMIGCILFAGLWVYSRFFML
jgi:hypothetical protein